MEGRLFYLYILTFFSGYIQFVNVCVHKIMNMYYEWQLPRIVLAFYKCDQNCVNPSSL